MINDFDGFMLGGPISFSSLYAATQSRSQMQAWKHTVVLWNIVERRRISPQSHPQLRSKFHLKLKTHLLNSCCSLNSEHLAANHWIWPVAAVIWSWSWRLHFFSFCDAIEHWAFRPWEVPYPKIQGYQMFAESKKHREHLCFHVHC